jgi:hypothetical protein
MRRQIFGGIPSDEKKAIKAFAGQNTENALKTKPKVRRLTRDLSAKYVSSCLCEPISRDGIRSLQESL